MINGALYEALPIVGQVDPQTVTTTELFTDVVDMSKYDRVMFLFQMGGFAAEDITFRVVTCDSAGNNAAAFKTATTLTGHATNNDNVQAIIEVDNNDLAGGGTNADRYVKGGIVSAGAGGVCAVTAIGLSKQRPGTQLASVGEIEIDKD